MLRLVLSYDSNVLLARQTVASFGGGALAHSRPVLSTQDEVKAFLAIVKQSVAVGRWLMPPDIASVTLLGLTAQDVKDILLSLAVADYCKGPEPDRDPKRPGDVWFFLCALPDSSVVDLYIKLKVTPDTDYVVVLSFHPPEHRMIRPYESG